MANEHGALGEALLTGLAAVISVALLGAVVVLDPAACFRDDMFSQYLGASREIWQAAVHGHVALLTPRSWFGGALAAEYQHGVFSPFAVATHVLAWSIGGTLRRTAFLLVALPIALLAAGTFRLARLEGCSREASFFAMVLTTFQAWTLRWALAWYPALASFAWVPWLLWSLRRPGRTRPFLVAVTVHAIFSGGWPFTLAMAFLAAVWAFAVELLRTRRSRPLLPVAFGLLLGVCMAAPALLMIAHFGRACERLQEAGWISEWTIPIAALPSLFTPVWRADWLTFGAAVTSRRSVELWSLLALATLGSAALVPSCRVVLRQRVGVWVALAAVALVLACLPGFSPFRWTFRWLPLWHLAIGIAAGKALDVWSEAPSPRAGSVPTAIRALQHPAGLSLVLVGVASMPALASPSWNMRADAVGAVCAAAVSCAAWWLLGRLGGVARTFAPPVLAATSALWNVRAIPVADVPTWKLSEALAEPAPLDPARTYLTLCTSTNFANGIASVHEDCRFGNLPLLAGLSFVNGYSPMRPLAVATSFPLETHGMLVGGPRGALALANFTRGTLLDDFGVDGLLVPALESYFVDQLVDHGWSVVASIEGVAVLHKGNGPAPRAWLLDDVPSGRHERLRAPPLRLEESDTEATVRFDVPLDRPAVVVFKRPAYPGYRAAIDGVPARLGSYGDTLLAVRIPAGTRGPVCVRYWPHALTRGLVIATAAAVVLGLWFAATCTRSRRLEVP